MAGAENEGTAPAAPAFRAHRFRTPTRSSGSPGSAFHGCGTSDIRMKQTFRCTAAVKCRRLTAQKRLIGPGSVGAMSEVRHIGDSPLLAVPG